MPRKASTVFAVAALAGIAAVTLGASKRTALPAAATPPPVAAVKRWELADTRADRAAEIIAYILIVIGIAAFAFCLFVPAAARAMPASNDEIRSHYGVNVVDNPNFKGATFLKGGDDGLAYVCDRPSQGDVMASKDLFCHVA
jgi:hypothetical protein